MGYSGSGFVFTSEPSWKDIAKNLPESIELRGYKHLSSNIWLLDAWHTTPRIHTPFEEIFTEELKDFLPQSANDLIKTFETILYTIDEDSYIYESESFRFTSQLSKICKADCFFFAGDDNDTDMACLASDGKLKQFRVRHLDYAIEFLGKNISFIPFDFINYPEQNLEPETIKQISQIPHISIFSPQKEEDDSPLFESALRLWPSGNATELLGIGSWEPFENLDSDYSIIYKRIQPSKKYDSNVNENKNTFEAKKKPENKIWAVWFASWGIKLFGVCIGLLSVGGAIGKIFFYENLGKGLTTELYYILVPIWSIGILGIIFIQIGWVFWPNRYNSLGKNNLEGNAGISPKLLELLKPFSIFISIGVLMASLSAITSKNMAKDFPGYSGHIIFISFLVYAIGLHFLTFHYDQKEHTIMTTYLRYFSPPGAFFILPLNFPILIFLLIWNTYVNKKLNK